jgi:hypothetical protein
MSVTASSGPGGEAQQRARAESVGADGSTRANGSAVRRIAGRAVRGGGTRHAARYDHRPTEGNQPLVLPAAPPVYLCEEFHKPPHDRRETHRRLHRSPPVDVPPVPGGPRHPGQHDRLQRRAGAAVGTTPAQVRKDLSFFGSFGKRGPRLSRARTHGALARNPRAAASWRVIIIGAGKIGAALANYRGFRQRGFTVVGVYDNEPRQDRTAVG